MRHKCIVVLFAVLMISPIALAQTSQESRDALSDANSIIQEMNSSDLPVNRVSDLYKQANSSYNAQIERNRSGKETDYTEVLNTVEQIKDIRREAFRTKDQLDILRSRMDELGQDGDLNLTSANERLENAETEFQDGRFEKSQEQIDLAYQEISEAQSAVTQAQAYAQATRDKFQTFLEDNWKRLSAALVLISLISYLGYKEYQLYSLKSKKTRLKSRREVLQDLIADAQNQYFQKNDLSESAYNTRTDKYGEMIRNINRQIPLINEELAKKTSLSKIVNQKILQRTEEGQEA